MKPANTDEYFAALSGEQLPVMQRLRSDIAGIAPDAEEGFSYDMPAFKLGGRWLIWYAAWKKHYSLYPVSPELLGPDASDLDGYETAKGTVRFPANQPLPHDLVKKLVKARITEVEREDRLGVTLVE